MVQATEPSSFNEALYSLAYAPHRCVKMHTGCIVNGVRFLTKERGSRRRSQNSGIVVEGNHGDETIDFFGELHEIIQLDYVRDRHVFLFKCKWFDLGKRKSGIQKEGNITSVKIIGYWYENDSFVLADQAKQVFYLNDQKLGSNWRVVQIFQHKHIYDVDEMENEDIDDDQLTFTEDEIYQEFEINDSIQVEEDEAPSLHRVDMDPEDFESLVLSKLPEGDKHDEASIDIDENDELDDTLVEYCDSDEDIENNTTNVDVDIDIDDDIDMSD